MRKAMLMMFGVTLLALVPTAGRADTPQCLATDFASLTTALTTGFNGKPCPMVLVTKDITVTDKLDVPDNTSVIGFIEKHPFQQVALNFDAKLTINDCAISLNYKANLANLLITTKQQVQNAVCINKGGSMIMRTSIDGPYPGDGFVTGIRNASSGDSILSDNTVNTAKDGIIIGNSPSNLTILMRNRISTIATGGLGLMVAAPPTIMLGNELIGTATLQFPKTNLFPLGTAANIIKLNNLVGSKDDGSDRSNFYELYHILPKSLKSCDAPVGYAPYNEDGSCKSYVFGKADVPPACPLNQIKLADGTCGCPDTLKLDATSNLCFQEKVVETVVEKPAEVIVEKPASSVTTPLPATQFKTDFPPIVANPGSGGGSCSLVPEQAISSLTPVAVFLLTIGLTGFTAYRSSVKTPRGRGKTKE